MFIQTVIHHAAQAKLYKQTGCIEQILLEALAHLCEQGGDPTCVCKQGKTPKSIVIERNIKIAVALLGMCCV